MFWKPLLKVMNWEGMLQVSQLITSLEIWISFAATHFYKKQTSLCIPIQRSKKFEIKTIEIAHFGWS